MSNPLTAEELKIVQVSVTISGTLSLIGGTALALRLFLGRRHQGHQEVTSHLLGWLGVFDAIYGASFLLGEFPFLFPDASVIVTDVACYSAILGFCWGTTTIAWTAIFAWYTCGALVRGCSPDIYWRRWRWLLVATWLLPVALVVTLLANVGFEYDCTEWARTRHDPEPMWYYTIYVTAELGAIGYTAWQYVRIALTFRRWAAIRATVADDGLRPRFVTQTEARLSTYLAGFLLCQGIAFADALANMCGYTFFWLYELHAAATPLQGFVNALLYWRPSQISCCKPCADSGVRDSVSGDGSLGGSPAKKKKKLLAWQLDWLRTSRAARTSSGSTVGSTRATRTTSGSTVPDYGSAPASRAGSRESTDIESAPRAPAPSTAASAAPRAPLLA